MFSLIQSLKTGQQSSRISLRKGSKKSKHFGRGIQCVVIIVFILLFIGLLLGSFVVSSNSDNVNGISSATSGGQSNVLDVNGIDDLSHAKSQLRRENALNEQDDDDDDAEVAAGIKPASDEKLIIDSLFKLAEMPANELQAMLDEGSYDVNNDLSDYFKLSSLKKGICPYENHDSII